jgi:predicted small lipoprotein YifL
MRARLAIVPPVKRRWIFASALSTLAALATLAGCGHHGPARAPNPADAPIGDPTEAAPPKTLFTAKSVASLFSYPLKLTLSESDLGPEWSQKGKVVWSVALAAEDDTFAPVTLILFDGHYRGLTISDDQKDILRRSSLFKDLAFSGGRTGYAMRAAGDAGDTEETALIPSPRGRYELLVLVTVPKAGPTEAPGTEAYRALLTEYTVRLVETVARGLEAEWNGKKP